MNGFGDVLPAMNVLALITARGGSVGLPRKNVLPLGGKPLIVHSIEAAAAARSANADISRIVVSTDDPEIAEVSRRFGAEVPFLRPETLARPDTPSLPVVEHAVAALEAEGAPRFDWVLLLQPTSPLRTAGDIREALRLAAQGSATAVIGVTEANSSHPAKLRVIEDGLLRPYLGGEVVQTRRQELGSDVYKTNGAIYLARRGVLLEEGSFYGKRPLAYVMPPERSIDIDTPLDFEIAEFLLSRRGWAEGGEQRA